LSASQRSWAARLWAWTFADISALAVRTHRPRERLLSPSGDGGPNRQKRAAVIGLAPKPKGRVYEVAELLRDTTLAVWASARWHDSSSAAAEC
jgi:hypothetical protein